MFNRKTIFFLIFSFTLVLLVSILCLFIYSSGNQSSDISLTHEKADIPTIEVVNSKPISSRIIVVDKRLDCFINSKNDHDRIQSIPDKILYEQDQQAVIEVLRNISESDVIRNQAALLLINSKYKLVRLEIQNTLSNHNQSQRYRGYCIQHLWTLYNKAPSENITIVDDIRRLIHDPAPEVRRESLLFLTRVKDRSEERRVGKECRTRGTP